MSTKKGSVLISHVIQTEPEAVLKTIKKSCIRVLLTSIYDD
jgi:hypothetical protein